MSSITDKKIEDIKKELEEKQEALRSFRFGMTGSKTRNTMEGRNLRRRIAALLTEINRRIRNGSPA